MVQFACLYQWLPGTISLAESAAAKAAKACSQEQIKKLVVIRKIFFN